MNADLFEKIQLQEWNPVTAIKNKAGEVKDNLVAGAKQVGKNIANKAGNFVTKNAGNIAAGAMLANGVKDIFNKKGDGEEDLDNDGDKDTAKEMAVVKQQYQQTMDQTLQLDLKLAAQKAQMNKSKYAQQVLTGLNPLIRATLSDDQQGYEKNQ